jgi:type I restriction enzyme M protein
VLFGSTEAHIRLRRELLTEHLVEAIISLPAGVFQPYAGVKTSILVFQKETRKEDRDKWKPVDVPRTQSVWFYEVTEEGYSRDAKRAERRGENNDLWDALEKFQTRYDPAADALVYYQPNYEKQRWRMVDQHTLEVFADKPEVLNWKDRVAAMHELFADLPADPQEAQGLIEQREQPALRQLALACLNDKAREAKATLALPRERSEHLEYTRTLLRKDASRFRTPCNQQRNLVFDEESVAWPLFQKSLQMALDWAVDTLAEKVVNSAALETLDYDSTAVADEAHRIAREFAKLDGYDVMLRTLHVSKRDEPLTEPKSWLTPVRVYEQIDDWQSEDGRIRGSHDEHGNVRPEYVASITLYDDKGNLKEGLLDPECIEARDWDLRAGQYKPFTFLTVQSDKSVTDMLRRLQIKEQQIADGLDKLLAMVEGRE